MKNKFKNLPFYILSFLIPSVILGIIFYIKNITPFGSGSLIIGDLEWQFVPFVNEFCEKLK
ncbi:MAG: YfhO family protein, partial [Lachnospiraceae bacterium]|nr:YfhO family protein [Lachnospiraceae bacterium]